MDWCRISANSGDKDVWLEARAHNKPEEMTGPWYMPDGRTSVPLLLSEGRLDEIPFPIWFVPFNRGKRFGDMLWTGGSNLKIASVRMIRALESVGTTGYRTFEVDVRDHADSPVDGYVGFATDPAPETDIQNLLGQEVQNMAFIAKRPVIETLRAHGADKLDIRPYDPSQYGQPNKE